MSTIRSILQEVAGLFVDDGALALVIAAIVAMVVALDALRLVSGALLGILLVGGAIGALTVSILRARRA